jgi:hypothetical protein
MNTEYYQKYLKYKKKYLDLKNIEFNLENQQGAWDAADPSGKNYLETNREYYDLSNNPQLGEDVISNAWPSYNLTNRYKMAEGNQLYNLYVNDFIFPLDDMSNLLSGHTNKSAIISSLDLSKVADANAESFQGLAQIYFANTIRDMSNIVNKYLIDQSANFSDLSKTYHDLSHDISQNRYYFIPTRKSMRNIFGTIINQPSLRLYHNDFYGFDVSNSKLSNVHDLSNGLVKGRYIDDNTRLEYLKVDLNDLKNQNIKDTEIHNLKILQLLMDYHEAMEDRVLKAGEITTLKADITSITGSLTNETIRAKSLVSDLQKNKNESAMAKEFRDKEIKSLKEEREKRNNSISRLGNYLLDVKKKQPSKSNVITLNSFFGLN